MAYELPALPYGYDTLEPTIDEQTMRLHHGKHHNTYVANLNAALEKHPEADPGNVDVLIAELDSVPDDIRTAVRNNGGGHANHSMFWQMLAPNSGAGGDEDLGEDLAEAITWGFGSLGGLKERFAAAAAPRHPLWLGLGVADRQPRPLAFDRDDAQPGLSADGGKDARAGFGRVGARLLPEVPEPSRGVHKRLLERGELAGGRETLRGGAFLMAIGHAGGP